jgi:hypothetical protein
VRPRLNTGTNPKSQCVSHTHSGNSSKGRPLCMNAQPCMPKTWATAIGITSKNCPSTTARAHLISARKMRMREA